MCNDFVLAKFEFLKVDELLINIMFFHVFPLV